LEVKIFELEENRASVEQHIALCTELSQHVFNVLSMPMPSTSKNLVKSAQALAIGEPA
jgi:hypothetical protein